MLSALNVATVVALIAGIYYFLKPKAKYPPGPWNIPFLSGIYRVGDFPHLTYTGWAKKYGPLIRTKFGLRDALIISDAKLIREAFAHPAFNGRPDYKTFTLFSQGQMRGIINGEGEEWAEQRRFAVRKLRDFGFGKSSAEEFIADEVRYFLKWMKDNEGVPIEIIQRLTLAMTNPLWKMIAGAPHDQDDEVLQNIVETANTIFSEAEQYTKILIWFPKLLDILPKIFLKKWYTIIEKAKPFNQIFEDAVAQHIQNPVDESEPRDLIDAYLTEVRRTTDSKSSFYGERGITNLEIVIDDLYSAAQLSTPSVVNWSIVFLVRFPLVQEKLQKELDAVIGRNRLPSVSDRHNLPYTEAVTLELHRHATQLPFALLHQTTEDATLGGYFVEKGTVVIPNFYAINESEEIYGDPEVFRPERFLTSDGKSLANAESMMPFGTGKRVCPGESLGRDTVFLFFASIFQRFEFGPDPSGPLPSLSPAPGFFLDPKKYKVVVKARF